MIKTLLMPQEAKDSSSITTARGKINSMIDDLIMSLPNPDELTSDDRRGIVARYTAALEGNFIYWMTATFISVQSEEARAVILDNLLEEVRDAHPAMLRRFAIAAHAVPTDFDAPAVDQDLAKVRVFLGRLSGVQSVVTMAFFEGFIQRFMGYLADLASLHGSPDLEYTEVHGVCDVAHTERLFQTLTAEIAHNPWAPEKDILQSAFLLRSHIGNIVFNQEETRAA